MSMSFVTQDVLWWKYIKENVVLHFTNILIETGKHPDSHETLWIPLGVVPSCLTEALKQLDTTSLKISVTCPRKCIENLKFTCKREASKRLWLSQIPKTFVTFCRFSGDSPICVQKNKGTIMSSKDFFKSCAPFLWQWWRMSLTR